MKQFPLIAALCFLAQSCSIDADLNPPCSEPGGWGYATIVSPEDKPFRNAPSSNSLNYNEFVYISDDNGIEGYWKYNMVTKQKSLIAEIEAWEPPYWSIKDWIVFGSNAQIFICKSNGDSLKQLTFENNNYDPSWSPDGQYIIFKSNISNFRIININGGVFKDYDSTIYAGNSTSWSSDGEKIAFISTYNSYDKNMIAYFDINEPDIIHYLPSSLVVDKTLLGPLDWLPDSKTILYTLMGNIYSINIETGNTQLIKEGIDCEYYYYHTILADGETIITVKHDGSYDAETNTEYNDYDLIKINPNGTEEIIPY